jgi:hypothetical protein
MVIRDCTILLVEDDEDDYLLMERYLADSECCQIILEWVDRYDEALEYMQDNSWIFSLSTTISTAITTELTWCGIKESGRDVPAILVLNMILKWSAD